jgi:Uma2 family endonuclease
LARVFGILSYHALNWKNRMRIETTKKLFTVDDYYRMAEAGILTPEDRVELIDGEIIEMSPIGDRHAGCVNRANFLFTSTLGQRVVVSVQNPLRLSMYTEPEPDIVLLKPRADHYASKKVTAEGALLVLEVAETTLRYDCDIKLPRYAKAGVPEVWIESLNDDLLLVYRDPSCSSYSTSFVRRRGDTISPVAIPDVVFSVEQLLV